MRGRKIYKGSPAYYERQDMIFNIITYMVVAVIIGIAILALPAIEYAVDIMCG